MLKIGHLEGGGYWKEGILKRKKNINHISIWFVHLTWKSQRQILFSYHFVLFQPEISSLISQDLSPCTEFHGATILTAIEVIYRPKNHERGSLVYWDDERGSFVYWDDIVVCNRLRLARFSVQKIFNIITQTLPLQSVVYHFSPPSTKELHEYAQTDPNFLVNDRLST